MLSFTYSDPLFSFYLFGSFFLFTFSDPFFFFFFLFTFVDPFFFCLPFWIRFFLLFLFTFLDQLFRLFTFSDRQNDRKRNDIPFDRISQVSVPFQLVKTKAKT